MIFSNASSSPLLFCTRRFTFASFGACGRAPLTIGFFDVPDDVGTAERDLRFPIISATLRVALKIFGLLPSIILGAAILPAGPGAISGQNGAADRCYRRLYELTIGSLFDQICP